MKSILEKLTINKDSKISRNNNLYSIYENDSDVSEGDEVLFSCREGSGGSIFVKCIIAKIEYDKNNPDKISRINIKLDDNNVLWVKESYTINARVKEGLSGYRYKMQILKLNN